MLVPVSAYPRGAIQTTYTRDQLQIEAWFRPGPFQARTATLRLRDYVHPGAYTEAVLDTSFFVYSFKQFPRQDLPRNFLLDSLCNIEVNHYGRLLVLKLDEENHVHSMSLEDYEQLRIVLFRYITKSSLCSVSS